MSSDDAPRRALGVCYYPEHWPEEIWRADAAQMAQSGLTWVRIGEFAWSRLEPAPGALDWGWLDRAIGILGAAGLKVVLGTPTATPPRWMLDRWPDMLALDEIGNPRKFGSRRHYCFSHEGYRGECARITRLLAERYGANPHVHAWQTDNEYGCHDTTVSYSASALTGFRRWLARKYRSPEALNAAWGNVFWSMEYREFAEIDLPNMTVSEPNPSHVLDFRRYSSEQVAEFNRVQTGILRECSDAPILHNFMARTVDFDHYRVADDLDIAAWDSYPLGNLERHSDLGEDWKLRFLRQGDPDFQAFHHDLYRAVGRGRWWVAEQQPGPVNWARFNPAPLPGMTRLWVWEAFAHGAEAVCYFRWRQAPFAQEQMHAGLLRPDNLAAPALAEAGTVASELAQLPDAETAPAPVALVFDYESAWGWKTQPQGGDFDYFRLVFDFYRAMRKLGLSIDVLRPESGELGGYRLIAMPGLMTVGAALSGALGSFSGTVLAGPRSGAKTPSMQIPPGLPPDIPGFDCTVELVESLPPGAAVPLERGGSFVRWFEKLSEHEEVRERTAKGEPALVGSATRLYLAGWPDDAALARILKALCDTADIETTSLPDTVRLRDTPSHRFLFNYGAEPAEACEMHLKPAAVHWLSRSQ